jgi:hypothetical protein
LCTYLRTGRITANNSLGFNHTTKTNCDHLNKFHLKPITLTLKSNKGKSITYTYYSYVYTDWLAAQHIINEPHISTSILVSNIDATSPNTALSHSSFALAAREDNNNG